MAKKTKKEKRRIEQICLPKCCQQPRSRGPKPRTDFSFFLSSSSSASSSCSSAVPGDIVLRRLPGSVLEFSTCKDALSSITTASMDEVYDSPFSGHEKKMLKFPLIRYGMCQNEVRKGLFLNSTRVPSVEDESVAQNVLLDTCNHGNTGRHKNDSAEELAFTPDKSTSRVAENNGVWITPGRKIMEERPAPVNPSSQVVDGRVLVKHYGNNECAWVDPAGEFSRFEDALHQKEFIHSCIKLDESPDRLKGTIQHDQSSDKCNASSSSRTEGDYLETGRGKRKRKPKVHFDEVTFPTKSMRKLRRFRIMRFLGLAAPVGSPFSVTSPVRTDYKSY